MVDTVEPGSVNVFDPYDGQVKVGKPEGEWDGKNHLFDSFKTHSAAEKYSGTAIDLIADQKSNSKPIRSDIERLCRISDEDFKKWYQRVYGATDDLLSYYQGFAAIPNLDYSSEDQRFDMTVIPGVKTHIEYLQKGMEYIKQVKGLRAAYRGYEQEIKSWIEEKIDEMKSD